MQLLPGVGPTSAQRVFDFTAEAAHPISEIANAPVPSRVGGEDWSAFVATIEDLRTCRAGWPAELERARLWYEPHLDRIHENALVRRTDLIQLEQIAAGYPSRESFLTELTLVPPDATSDQAGVPLLDEDNPHTAKALDTLAETQDWEARRHDEDAERLHWES
jgi:DNA helicase-2/ATP-dependent DNA helicase PcrA